MRFALTFAAACGCTSPEADTPPPDPDPVDTSPPPTDSSPGTGTTGETGATGDTGPALDCSLPPVPAPFRAMREFDTAEDFDFDGEGYLCSITNGNLACNDLYGNGKLVGAGVVGVSAGTRVLPTGDWVICDVGRGAVLRVDTQSGASEPIATGLVYPNGLEVDRDNRVYVSDLTAGRVLQIDAYTGEQWIVAEGLSDPNGVILSPDDQTLYVGSLIRGLVYAIDRRGPTEWDEERIAYETPETHTGFDIGFDGINVDVCGNIYVTQLHPSHVYRITPDGSQIVLVADLPASWIPNLRWGHGIGGWRTDVLYVTGSSDGIYALDVGIEGKKHILVP